jgi:hypothetical protein
MASISAAETDFGGSGLSGFGFGRAMRGSAKGAYSDEIRSVCRRGRARRLKDGSGRRKSARMGVNAR